MDFKKISANVVKASTGIERDYTYAGQVFTLGMMSPNNEVHAAGLYLASIKAEKDGGSSINETRAYRLHIVAASIRAVNGEAVPEFMEDTDSESGEVISVPSVEVITAEVATWPENVLFSIMRAATQVHFENNEASSKLIGFDWSDVDFIESDDEVTQEDPNALIPVVDLDDVESSTDAGDKPATARRKAPRKPA